MVHTVHAKTELALGVLYGFLLIQFLLQIKDSMRLVEASRSDAQFVELRTPSAVQNVDNFVKLQFAIRPSESSPNSQILYYGDGTVSKKFCWKDIQLYRLSSKVYSFCNFIHQRVVVIMQNDCELVCQKKSQGTRGTLIVIK